MARLAHRIRTRLSSPGPWQILAGLVSLALLGLLLYDYAKLRTDYQRLGSRLRVLEARGFTREEIQTQLVEELAYTRASVTDLMRERSLGRALLEEHGGGICLVHLAYR